MAQKGLRSWPNITELMAGPWPEVASFSEKPSKRWALLVYSKLCYTSTLPGVNSWKILNGEGGKSVLLFRASLNASVSRARINTFSSGGRTYRPQPRIVSGLGEYFKTPSLSAPGNLTWGTHVKGEALCFHLFFPSWSLCQPQLWQWVKTQMNFGSILRSNYGFLACRCCLLPLESQELT